MIYFKTLYINYSFVFWIYNIYYYSVKLLKEFAFSLYTQMEYPAKSMPQQFGFGS